MYFVKVRDLVMELRNVSLLGVLMLAACTEPAGDPADDFWDDAEVDAVCLDLATTYSSCEGDSGPTLTEFAEVCRESMLVDNPNATEACYQAKLAENRCLAQRTCDELAQDIPCEVETAEVSDKC